MYGGEVSSLKIPFDQIITQGKCLSISVPVARRLKENDKIHYRLKIMEADSN